MDRAVAYAYLSAASDVQISQVVDRTKGTNILIRKSDFKAITGDDKAARAE
jgi:acetamidase/formamidase